MNYKWLPVCQEACCSVSDTSYGVPPTTLSNESQQPPLPHKEAQPLASQADPSFGFKSARGCFAY